MDQSPPPRTRQIPRTRTSLFKGTESEPPTASRGQQRFKQQRTCLKHEALSVALQFAMHETSVGLDQQPIELFPGIFETELDRNRSGAATHAVEHSIDENRSRLSGGRKSKDFDHITHFKHCVLLGQHAQPSALALEKQGAAALLIGDCPLHAHTMARAIAGREA